MSGVKKRKVDTESRQLEEKWTDEYFFTMHYGKPTCLLCNGTLSDVKESHMKRHYSSKHVAQHTLTGQPRKDKIRKLITSFEKQRKHSDNALKASFIISSKLAKSSKPFTEGEFIKECLLEITDVICPEKKKEFENISLSRRQIVRRIDMMADDINIKLAERASEFEAFSIALDEITDLFDTARLAIFIRGVDKEFTVTEELLTLQPLIGTYTGEDVFNEVGAAIARYGLQWSGLIGVCTNGAPSMTSLRKGFISILKEKAVNVNVDIEDLIILHSIVHYEDFWSNSQRLLNVMDVVVKSMNVCVTLAPEHHPFKLFFDDLTLEHNDFTYYCKGKWISKCKMLKRFYVLRQEIAELMEMKNKPLSLEVSDRKWACDLAFLVDVTEHLHVLNLKLQRPGQLVNELYSHLKAFQNKIIIWETQMRSENCYHFPTLFSHEVVAYSQYAEELKFMSDYFSTRLADFKNMESNFSLFTIPTESNVEKAPSYLQMELIELQQDIRVKRKFEDVELLDFYKTYLLEEKYPHLREFARNMICAFGSMCKCEQIFSKIQTHCSKQRSKQNEEHFENTLRVNVSGIEPDINKLVLQIQAQTDHSFVTIL